MKFNKLNIAKLFSIIVMAGLFVSCGKNPVNPEEKDNTAKVVGVYSGRIDFKVGANDLGSVYSKTLELMKKNNDSVDVILSAFEFSKYKIPEIPAVAKVTANADGTYTIEGKVDMKSTELTMNGTFVGKIEPKLLEPNEIEVNYTLNFPGMTMPVLVKFTSKAPPKVNLTVDATSYDNWVYVDFATGKTVTHSVKENIDEKSFAWDIAIHRYDVRTNGCSAKATEFTSLDSIRSIPTGAYLFDVQDSIIIDMSGMAGGSVKYMSTKLNKVLSSWLTVDMSKMPPTFTMSKVVYVISTADKKAVKILFTDFANKENKKGYISFSYQYLNI